MDRIRRGLERIRIAVLGLGASLCLCSLASASGPGGTQLVASFGIDVKNGFFNISGPLDWANPDACEVSSFVTIPLSNAFYKDVEQAVIMANSTNKKIVVYVNGCVATPWGQAPLIQSVSVWTFGA
jgi:hypothetical protein